MSFTTFVATRYLASGRRHKFFSWISILSILGVAIGVATLIVVLSVINGFESELRKRFLSANAHVLLFRYPGGMKDPESWAKRVREDFKQDVKGISPFVHYETILVKDGLMQAVLVRGFEPKVREAVQTLKDIVTPPSALDIIQQEEDQIKKTGVIPSEPSIIVGDGLRRILNLAIGDSVQMISPHAQAGQESKTFKIVGFYISGLKIYDNRLCAMSLHVAQDFFDTQGSVTGLEIGLRDPNESMKIAAKMAELYPLQAKGWQAFNRKIMKALETERALIFLIVVLVAVVAGFNILTTLFVAVTQKQKEISILKALGASNRQIVVLFLKQGALYGWVGSILGVILAVIISIIIKNLQFLDLPDPYYLRHLPVDMSIAVYLIMSFLGVIICIASSLIPAYSAAKIIPTLGLRGQVN